MTRLQIDSALALLGGPVLVLSSAAICAADGPAQIGDEFQVNSYTTSYQGYYGFDVSMTGNGEFVVAWSSWGSYGTDSDQESIIQGQRYSTGTVFTDGFESGDTTVWSVTVGQ